MYYNFRFQNPGTYRCPTVTCDHTTDSRVGMKRHIMAEINYKPWRCPHCEYRDVQAGGVKRHCAIKHKLKNEFGYLNQEADKEEELNKMLSDSRSETGEHIGVARN